MNFTQIPQNFAPLGDQAIYAFEATEVGNFDFRITDETNNKLLGVKRFVGASSGHFDISPYLRGSIRYTPACGATGFITDAARTVTTVVEAAGVRTPARTLLQVRESPLAPAILTSIPDPRLISPGECDEITLFTSNPCTATLVARHGDTTEGLNYQSPGSGMKLFRLNTADFPEAESITLSFGGVGEVEYLVVPHPATGCRVAWLSSAGSVEHYTFPMQKAIDLKLHKEQIYSNRGYQNIRIECQRQTTLLSAYEPQATICALSEITTSPAVWLVEEETYTSIDVVNTEAAIQRHGSLCCVEITIRPIRKTCIR